MFSSLRSRLWLTYALLVFVALFIVAAILIVYLIRNPLVNRQTVASLHADETVILKDRVNLASLDPAELQSKSEEYDRTFDVRVIILNRNRQLISF